MRCGCHLGRRCVKLRPCVDGVGFRKAGQVEAPEVAGTGEAWSVELDPESDVGALRFYNTSTRTSPARHAPPPELCSRVEIANAGLAQARMPRVLDNFCDMKLLRILNVSFNRLHDIAPVR